MIVMGVDPGPKDFAWALYSEDIENITAWDTVTINPVLFKPWEMWRQIESQVPNPDDLTPDLIAIEQVYSPVKGSQRIRTQYVDATNRMVGVIQMSLGRIYRETPVILVSRSTVKAALPGITQRDTDKQVNRVMRGLCSGVDRGLKGLNSHTRAAAALAYVAAGQFKRQKAERMLEI